MTVAYTSFLAYNQIAKDLPEMQRAVFEVLSDHPEGMTNKEIARTLFKDANEIIGRLNELNCKGLVTRCMKKFCRITGKLAISWRAVTTDPQGRMTF
jgi:hypothetical protein